MPKFSKNSETVIPQIIKITTGKSNNAATASFSKWTDENGNCITAIAQSSAANDKISAQKATNTFFDIMKDCLTGYENSASSKTFVSNLQKDGFNIKIAETLENFSVNLLGTLITKEFILVYKSGGGNIIYIDPDETVYDIIPDKIFSDVTPVGNNTLITIKTIKNKFPQVIILVPENFISNYSNNDYAEAMMTCLYFLKHYGFKNSDEHEKIKNADKIRMQILKEHLEDWLKENITKHVQCNTIAAITYPNQQAAPLEEQLITLKNRTEKLEISLLRQIDYIIEQLGLSENNKSLEKLISEIEQKPSDLDHIYKKAKLYFADDAEYKIFCDYIQSKDNVLEELFATKRKIKYMDEIKTKLMILDLKIKIKTTKQ